MSDPRCPRCRGTGKYQATTLPALGLMMNCGCSSGNDRLLNAIRSQMMTDSQSADKTLETWTCVKCARVAMKKFPKYVNTIECGKCSGQMARTSEVGEGRGINTTAQVVIECTACQGKGRIVYQDDGRTRGQRCARCLGSGNIYPVMSCSRCDGSGTVVDEEDSLWGPCECWEANVSRYAVPEPKASRAQYRKLRVLPR